ncbi:MAG: EpsG family protein [Candidatus Omnitrophica bacterium]|nr:EpsG family protein [Candidatus Omnitrophota bacterium]MDD5352696.1 EpsG family protein [Candidatus Omnitrophota bacterium]MDD5550295.1 EpsG family protein [Candidatus Omnitrophota bacterium]
MKLKDKIVDVSRWDSYAFVILLLAIIFQLLRWRIFPIFLDVYYHLLTAVGFNEAGGWISHCFWSFAPVGRPQLYPPLLHIIILLFLKMSMPVLIIGKLLQCVIYPLLLFVIWYVIRKIFDKKVAFFSVFMLFSVYPFYLTAINTLAASLALIFCFLSLLFLERNKVFTASLLFALAFYSHGFTPWLFLCVFIFYGLLNKAKLKSCLKVCALALFLASPIIIYLFSMRHFYVFQKNNLGENSYIELKLQWVIFLFGLVECLRKKDKYYIFIALFLSSFILLFLGFIFRYFSFYGIMSLVFMNAVFLSSLYEKLNKRSRKFYLLSVFILFFILSPTLTIDLSKKHGINDKPVSAAGNDELIFGQGLFRLNTQDSSFLNFFFYGSRLMRTNEITIYYPRLFSELLGVINKNTGKEDIIYVNLPYTAGILSLLSNRATSSAMLSEVGPYVNFDQIASSRLIIWQKDPADIEQGQEQAYLIKKYNLKKIADTKLAFIYKNPECISKKQTLSASISYKVLFALIFLVFMLIIWSIKFDIDK